MSTVSLELLGGLFSQLFTLKSHWTALNKEVTNSIAFTLKGVELFVTIKTYNWIYKIFNT